MVQMQHKVRLLLHHLLQLALNQQPAVCSASSELVLRHKLDKLFVDRTHRGVTSANH
jgi:hypothetical protein